MMKRIMGVFMVGAAAIALAADKPAMKSEKPAEDEKASSLAVEKMLFCSGVQERVPQGEAASFAADAGSVWCWLTVTGAEGETEIKQTWWHKGELVREIPLSVRAARWRTWGHKNIAPTQTGEWTVKITDAQGHVLKEATFTVGEAPAPSKPADTKKP